MAYGVDIEKFWGLNPHVLGIYAEAHAEKMKLLDEQMWIMGLYVARATYVSVGRVVHGSKFNDEYPDKPFSWPKKTQAELTAEETERELQRLIQVEEAWIRNEMSRGLPMTI